MKTDRVKLADQVIQKLHTIEDPELFVDIVNLGLIYGVDLAGNKCTISMTLTTMGCPLNDYLEEHIKQAVLSLPEIKQVEIKLVWYPVWTVDRMSEAAKKALGVGQPVKQEKRAADKRKKVLDLHTPIKTFADRYPEFVKDMYDIGFTRITIPGMLNTVGRVMTLKLGAKAMGFDLDKVKHDLEQKGYQIDD
ncbi:MAG: iron-sulfur cluster assembly protein [Lactobacillus sp.]|jgi:metal-sulfur cluster biosynthetic enzyme|nr:iron-sulfur cluster assembly protein [Lactobacillus sp.]